VLFNAVLASIIEGRMENT